MLTTSFPGFNVRLYALPSILTLSLTTFILSIYFATTLHTNLSSSTVSMNLTISGNSSGDSRVIQPTNYPGYNHSAAYNSYGLNGTDNHGGIIFYTGAVPVLSIIHTLMEGNIAVFSPASLESVKAQLICLWTALIMLAAWIVNNAFWLTCDLLPGSHEPGGVCPAQIRKGLQYTNAVRGVAITKSIFAWLVLGGYAIYLAAGIAAVRVAKRELQEQEKRDSEAQAEVLSINTVTGRED